MNFLSDTKSPIFFIAFIFLLAFALQISAQKESVDFTDVIEIGPKKIKGLKLGDYSPNELDDHKFFASGKLKGLKFGFSTKEDVAGIFGNNCKTDCEYDNEWLISFTYFARYFADITRSTSTTENKRTVKYVPDPKFADKLYSVKLIPRKRISFKDTVFPEVFYKSSSVAFGHDFDGKAIHVAFDSYTDSYGLRYTMFDKITFNTSKEKDDRKNGDLISIEYEIPKHIEKKLFIEQK